MGRGIGIPLTAFDNRIATYTAHREERAMSHDRSASADQFHRLHHEGLLLLANVWDAGSARLIENLGAKAIATSSAAVAWSHGYADGDILPIGTLAATVAEIARVIRVPLSVDMEGGYSTDPVAVGENVSMIVSAGGAGVNLEDASADPALLCAKIEHAKRAASRLGINLFVNARTDGYLRDPSPTQQKLDEAIARGERYRTAGADGLFVPGVLDASSIKAIASAVKLPLNVLARPALPPAAELAQLGVRRLSAGSGIFEVLFGRASTLAAEFLRSGISVSPTDRVMPYREINTLMAAR